MSKRKNVNPDHYKTGGSGHQGEDVVQKEHREKLARERAEQERWQARERERERQEKEKKERTAGKEEEES